MKMMNRKTMSALQALDPNWLICINAKKEFIAGYITYSLSFICLQELVYHTEQYYIWTKRWSECPHWATTVGKIHERLSPIPRQLEKTSSIENRGQTDCVTLLPHPYVLDIDLWYLDLLWPWLSIPGELWLWHTHTHAQTHVQRSVTSHNGVEQTDGQTDATDCFTFAANAVGNQVATDEFPAGRGNHFEVRHITNVIPKTVYA